MDALKANVRQIDAAVVMPILNAPDLSSCSDVDDDDLEDLSGESDDSDSVS